MTRQRVVILGGGMAGLAAAWRLTRRDGPGADVVVYQRGFRLGGKGASSRGSDGRIQEHGLHIWPGYYDNAFRLIRECYEELDRSRTDPVAPIRCFSDAFFPASTIGLVRDDSSQPWVANFPENDLVPGEGTGSSVGPLELFQRGVTLLEAFAESLVERVPPPRAVLSTRRRPSKLRSMQYPRLPRDLSSLSLDVGVGLVELLSAMMRGIVADGLASRGYSAIDDIDFCEWLRRHGGSARALASPLIRGMYDLVFGYEGGDRRRPRFAAGTGLQLAGRMFLTYRGAIFWKMRAGMGDVVFAPLYEALARRGVRFSFFSRVERLCLSPDRRSVDAIVIRRQARLRPGSKEYRPLVRIRGLPVFPDRADLQQLAPGSGPMGEELESHACTRGVKAERLLRVGRDFDSVVLAVPPGMIQHICGDLIEASPQWEDMVRHVATIPTHSAQLWLNTDERSMGWPQRAAVVTGFGPPFDTFASMSHTIPFEAWPDTRRPVTAASFCGALAEEESAAARPFPDAALNGLWSAYDPDMLLGSYYRANTDPSDRYVLALPGTSRYRLRADGSGFRNLVLAGDWVDCGLNAGCIEAATLAGLQAANVIEGNPITQETVGFVPHGVRLFEGGL